MRTLIIIPARGGSKGIPRKNLRDLAGKPLIFYSINVALTIEDAAVVVDTDDDEIEYMVKSFYDNVKVYQRKKLQGTDLATIDDVIFNHLKFVDYSFDRLVVLQPTSPLLSAATLKKALNQFSTYEYSSALAVKEFKHLLWKKDERGIPELIQNSRVNRQLMEPLYLETGAITITKKELIMTGVRIGDQPGLIKIPESESIDLDSSDDWSLAERALSLDKLYIYVAGNKEIGLGHVYNVLELAVYFATYSIVFFVDDKDVIAREILESYNYEVNTCSKKDLPNTLSAENGVRRLIIDALDTEDEILKDLIHHNVRVVSFEDRNVNKYEKRILINALYSGVSEHNYYYGYEYFVMRRQFVNRKTTFSENVSEVLISFGGADPQNYTSFCYTELRKHYKGNITLIIGNANQKKYSVDDKTRLLANVSNMAYYMRRADFAFTSAGRTSIECASMRLPAIVLNQNEREVEHEFAQKRTGFLRFENVEVNDEILNLKINEMMNPTIRKILWNNMADMDFKRYTRNTIEVIKNHIL